MFLCPRTQAQATASMVGSEFVTDSPPHRPVLVRPASDPVLTGWVEVFHDAIVHCL